MAKNILITPGQGVIKFTGNNLVSGSTSSTLTMDINGNLVFAGASGGSINYIAALGLDSTILAGTTSQIIATHQGANGRYILSLPSTLILPGTIEASYTPTIPNQLTTKSYVDSLTGDKIVARALSASNVTISNPGTIMFDGVNLSVGDRLMLIGQTTTTENGIYVFNGSGVALTRSADFDAWGELPQSIVRVQAGSLYNNTIWITAVQPGGTIGTTPIIFKRIDPSVTAPGPAGVVFSDGSVLTTGLIHDANIYDVDWTKITNVPSAISAIATLVVNNGLSLTVANHFVLGQDIGESGNPGKLLSSREIPLNGSNLVLTGAGALIIGSNSSSGSEKLQITGSAKVSGQISALNGNLYTELGDDAAVSPSLHSTAMLYLRANSNYVVVRGNAGASNFSALQIENDPASNQTRTELRSFNSNASTPNVPFHIYTTGSTGLAGDIYLMTGWNNGSSTQYGNYNIFLKPSGTGAIKTLANTIIGSLVTDNGAKLQIFGNQSVGVVASAATSLTIDSSATKYSYTGTAIATWTLPAISGKAGWMYIIKNRSAFVLTLNAANAGELYNTASINNISLSPGDSYILINDGTYWNIETSPSNSSGVAIDSNQTHITGSAVTASNGVNNLIINPVSTISALTITFPAMAHNSNSFDIFFGGSLLSGIVVTSITLAPNTAQSILQSTVPTKVYAGESISFKKIGGIWYRK